MPVMRYYLMSIVHARIRFTATKIVWSSYCIVLYGNNNMEGFVQNVIIDHFLTRVSDSGRACERRSEAQMAFWRQEGGRKRKKRQEKEKGEGEEEEKEEEIAEEKEEEEKEGEEKKRRRRRRRKRRRRRRKKGIPKGSMW